MFRRRNTARKWNDRTLKNKKKQVATEESGIALL